MLVPVFAKVALSNLYKLSLVPVNMYILYMLIFIAFCCYHIQGGHKVGVPLFVWGVAFFVFDTTVVVVGLAM